MRKLVTSYMENIAVQALYFGLRCSATEVTTLWLNNHSLKMWHNLVQDKANLGKD